MQIQHVHQPDALGFFISAKRIEIKIQELAALLVRRFLQVDVSGPAPQGWSEYERLRRQGLDHARVLSGLVPKLAIAYWIGMYAGMRAVPTAPKTGFIVQGIEDVRAIVRAAIGQKGVLHPMDELILIDHVVGRVGN